MISTKKLRHNKGIRIIYLNSLQISQIHNVTPQSNMQELKPTIFNFENKTSVDN